VFRFTVVEGEIFGLLGPERSREDDDDRHPDDYREADRRPCTRGRPRRGPRSTPGPIGEGVAFQDSVLYTEFSGRENLRLHAQLWGMPRREAEARIDFLLEAMGLIARATDGIRSCSGGMRRRVEIARALLANPKVVLLDEPTVGLDPAVRHELWLLVERMRRQQGVTILLSTHIPRGG
jgi:ABC-2 type transport system ATP-binding protein